MHKEVEGILVGDLGAYKFVLAQAVPSMSLDIGRH